MSVKLPYDPSKLDLQNKRICDMAPEMLEVIKEAEIHSRKRRPDKKATWLKMVSIVIRARGEA